jgi:hypothetical protein
MINPKDTSRGRDCRPFAELDSVDFLVDSCAKFRRSIGMGTEMS